MDDSTLYPHLYYKRPTTLWKAVDLFFESERAFYFDRSGGQDSFAFRHLYRARSLALFLIDDAGKLSVERIKMVLEAMDKEGAPLYPNSFFDEEVKREMQEGLSFFLKEKTAISLVERLKAPLKNRFLEALVRDSLLLKEGAKIEEKEIRRALLSALLFPLRQTLGSCFATAPAILIQREQKEQFLLDLIDLFTLSAIKRTFGGEEHIAPISLSWRKGGSRAEVSHPLLKTWEFTLATFSDYKVEFSKWNLVTSLGFDPSEEGGIGAVIRQKIEESFEEEKKKMEKAYGEYQRSVDEENVQNALLRSATSYEQVRTLKATLIATGHHLHAVQDLYEKAKARVERLSDFFSPLIHKYFEEFPRFFQEVYDVEMFAEEGFYDDSPAGFRLVYKQGRTDPSFWTMIHSGEEYLDALRNFFHLVEPEIFLAFEEEKKLLQEITTAVIHHLMGKEFLPSAFKRMKKAHRTFDLGEKKPWSYTSGGSLLNLLRCYYSIEGDLYEEKRAVESPLDFCIFLLELMKSLPHPVSKPFEEQEKNGMLASSPTHAYIFQPGLSPFKEGWLDPGFTYTWVRDQILHPAKEFYGGILLGEEEQNFLVKELMQEIGQPSKKLFTPSSKTIHLHELRNDLIEHFFSFKERGKGRELIDSFLQSAFPLIPKEQGLEIGERILSSLFGVERKLFSPSPLFSFSTFYDLLLEEAVKLEKHPSSSLLIRLDEALQKEGLFPPPPTLFADTNWSMFYFAFVVSPATLELELWRYDPRIRRGFPISSWEHWLNGSAKEPWSILASPRQYEARPRFGFEMLRKKI